MRTPPLLLEFLSIVRRKTGSSRATMLLHMEPVERQSLLLSTIGEGAVVPELADEKCAWALIEAQAKRDEGASGVDPITLIPSTQEDGVLVRITFDNILARPKAERRTVNERRSQPDIDTAPTIDGAIWFGLTACPDVRRFANSLQEPDGEQDEADNWLPLFTSLASKLAWSVYQLTGALQDPVSQLPGRMEFQLFLKRTLAAAQQHQQSIALLLVNPDDFTMINHRYGREQGDLAVREIADELTSSLRQTDGVFRYGGAVFGVVLPATNIEQCKAAAEKVRRRLTEREYIGESEHLTFSMGAAIAGPEDFSAPGVEVADLLKQADTALNKAKLSGGARIIVTGMDGHDKGGSDLGLLSGVFTADTEKDYRNMLLLWDTVGLVSAHPEPGDMARAFVDRLALGFQPDRIALFSADDDADLLTMATNVRDEAAADGRASGRTLELDEKRRGIIARALESRQVERLQLENDAATVTSTAYAVPLIAGQRTIGCVYLDGRGRRLQLDSSDVIFLNALASQMATALDRAQLAARWIRGKDQESRQLREELQELRQSLNQTAMIYESQEMHALIETVRRVAPSDATVLIIGESGTGKEMLAQSIHEFSDRRENPFVVFDCGAVAHSLLEAELFGHVKGAFTGAESASEGRIAQADGGTLCLDEIGELPLHVQAKLLRFVQEKEFAPVGSAQNRHVDVRIVAATNRKLQDEVAAGRFRADLYYRLQVISLQAIALRDRKVDILALADHFLQKFSAQYNSVARRFSDDARHKLHSYDWPGNVRELQHCILRAVLTADGDLIDAAAIELLPESRPETVAEPGAANPPEPQAVVPTLSDQTGNTSPPQSDSEAQDADPWQALREELLSQIQFAIDQNSHRPAPLGRWLTEDLVLAASEVTDNVARQAAKLMGIPETTFRRHHQKASAELSAGLAPRNPDWGNVGLLITKVVSKAQQENHENGEDLIDHARSILLEDVSQRVQGSISVGAALMGVTAPTYKRWLEARTTQQ